MTPARFLSQGLFSSLLKKVETGFVPAAVLLASPEQGGFAPTTSRYLSLWWLFKWLNKFVVPLCRASFLSQSLQVNMAVLAEDGPSSKYAHIKGSSSHTGSGAPHALPWRRAWAVLTTRHVSMRAGLGPGSPVHHGGYAWCPPVQALHCTEFDLRDPPTVPDQVGVPWCTVSSSTTRELSSCLFWKAKVHACYFRMRNCRPTDASKQPSKHLLIIPSLHKKLTSFNSKRTTTT